MCASYNFVPQKILSKYCAHKVCFMLCGLMKKNQEAVNYGRSPLAVVSDCPMLGETMQLVSY